MPIFLSKTQVMACGEIMTAFDDRKSRVAPRRYLYIEGYTVANGRFGKSCAVSNWHDQAIPNITPPSHAPLWPGDSASATKYTCCTSDLRANWFISPVFANKRLSEKPANYSRAALRLPIASINTGCRPRSPGFSQPFGAKVLPLFSTSKSC